MTLTAEQRNAVAYLRTLLILGRVSNLPTVWSNCLAGWLLAGGGDPALLIVVCLGTSFLYLGGMYLNDAFDAQFDQQHRPERPIPSGAIGAASVWQWGLSWLGLGLLSFSFLGPTTLGLAVMLTVTILIYDAIHKIFAFSPLLMASCRCWLALLAASTGARGVTGLSIWSALALAAYVTGLSFLARKESTPSPVRYWPCLFLGAPLLLALLVNRGEYQLRGTLLTLMTGLWMLRCLRFTFWSPQPNLGRTVSGLLAGIVLVDMLAVGGGTQEIGILFLGLFALALMFQRFIPAT